jgi:sulfur transfer protein SufE
MVLAKVNSTALALVGALILGNGTLLLPQAFGQKIYPFKSVRGAPDITGPIISVDPDGKSFAVQNFPRVKGEQKQRTTVKITDETELKFSWVTNDGARLIEGYQAQVYFKEDSTDTAAAVLAMGNEFFKPTPQLIGRVAKVEPDGKQFTLQTDAIPVKGKGADAIPGVPAKSIRVTIPEKADVSFSGVGPNGAKITEGYRAAVFLKEDSKDVPASVQFRGDLDAPKKGDKERPAHCQGTVVSFAADRKEITLELPAKSKWQPPKPLVIEIGDSTQFVYHNVPLDGAKPVPGYEAQVWFGEDAFDPPKKIRLGAAVVKTQIPDLAGPVRRVAPDAKSIVVLGNPLKRKGEEPKEVTVVLTDKTKVSYFNVPLGGARPAEGMQADIWLQNSAGTNASRISFLNVGN